MDLKLEAVAGHPYSKVLSGPHKGDYVNQTHNKRDGEFFALVEKAGRMQHVYGEGKDREVLTMPAKVAAPGAATDVSKDAATSDKKAASTTTPAAKTTSSETAKTTSSQTAKTTSAASTSAATDTAARLLAATGGLSAPDQSA